MKRILLSVFWIMAFAAFAYGQAQTTSREQMSARKETKMATTDVVQGYFDRLKQKKERESLRSLTCESPAQLKSMTSLAAPEPAPSVHHTRRFMQICIIGHCFNMKSATSAREIAGKMDLALMRSPLR